MGKDLRTIHGCDLFVVASALQKAIRRNEPRLACWAVTELHKSGYMQYAWKRLLIVSAEDCDGIITSEIEALYRAHMLIVEKSKKDKPRGLVFLTKATLLLCRTPKNRDADHAGWLVKQGTLVSEEEVLHLMNEVEASNPPRIPDYVYDVHTLKGRMRGKTREDFFRDEQLALFPKAPGVFDHLMPGGAPSDTQEKPPQADPQSSRPK